MAINSWNADLPIRNFQTSKHVQDYCKGHPQLAAVISRQISASLEANPKQ
jgi:hypothetical protein